MLRSVAKKSNKQFLWVLPCLSMKGRVTRNAKNCRTWGHLWNDSKRCSAGQWCSKVQAHGRSWSWRWSLEISQAAQRRRWCCRQKESTCAASFLCPQLFSFLVSRTVSTTTFQESWKSQHTQERDNDLFVRLARAAVLLLLTVEQIWPVGERWHGDSQRRRMWNVWHNSFSWWRSRDTLYVVHQTGCARDQLIESLSWVWHLSAMGTQTEGAALGCFGF